MKSTEVYRQLRTRFAPWCKSEGFRRTTGGMLGWHRARGDGYLVFWFQCSQHGWDPHIGSQLTLEFQRSTTAVIGTGQNRSRYSELLIGDELERVRALQNRVIAGLVRPPPGHWSEQLVGRPRDWYLAQFEPVREPYEARQDVWLRYASPEDLERWADFLEERFPRMLDEFESRASDPSRSSV